MSVIARRFWREPAVCIGALTTIALAILALAAGEPVNASTIAGIAAPLLAALGIRPLVTPAKGDEQPAGS